MREIVVMCSYSVRERTPEVSREEKKHFLNFFCEKIWKT